MNNYNIFNDNDEMRRLIYSNDDKPQTVYSKLFDDTMQHFLYHRTVNIVNDECVYKVYTYNHKVIKLLYNSANCNIYIEYTDIMNEVKKYTQFDCIEYDNRKLIEKIFNELKNMM